MHGIKFERSMRDPYTILCAVPEQFFAEGHPGEVLIRMRDAYRASVLDKQRQHRHIRLVLLRAKREKQVRIGRMAVVKRLRSRGHI